MRKLTILSGMVLLLCLAIPAIAQEFSDYGSPLNIDTSSIDADTKESLDLYRETHDSESLEEFRRGIGISFRQSPLAWSPNGEWIVFLGGFIENLWIVSSEGGEPRYISREPDYYVPDTDFDGGYRYGKIEGACFKPNSQELTFEERLFDEEKGSTLNIVENEDGAYDVNGANPVYTISSINIDTGEQRFLTDGRNPAWSNNGRYLCYRIFDYHVNFDELQAENHGELAILDTETGEKWVLTDGLNSYTYIHTMRFTNDDSAVIFSMETGVDTSQFFKVPVTGGEIEQISFSDNGGNKRVEFDISPDGEWLLYTDHDYKNIFSYTGSFSRPGGFTGSYSHTGVTVQLCFYNLDSGETYILFPEPQDTNMYGRNGLYSPDGTQIVYMLIDYNSKETKNGIIYIMDVDTDALQKISPYTEVTVVEDEPQSFLLLSNYPNPFNPQTTIEFTLPEAGFAELSIYNMAGQKVRELVATDMTAGIHSAVWDGRDQNGNLVSSGMFISRLKTMNSVKSNRMMLVK
ncbi:FlgD immunoglobulin-like domain containing protein [Candidatus Latescibacterota bacterium]